MKTRRGSWIRTAEKEFVTTCVGANGEDIQEMVDVGEEISYGEFAREVGVQNIQELSESLGYGAGPLTLEKDYHVHYYRSTYQGRPCVFMDHSAIEHVFC